MTLVPRSTQVELPACVMAGYSFALAGNDKKFGRRLWFVGRQGMLVYMHPKVAG